MSAPFHFATCAWGGHVDLMLEVMLPSLLAPGNLPALKNPGCVFTIYTRDEDFDRVQNSPVLQAVSNIMRTVGIVIPIDTTGPRGIYGPSTEAYIQALGAAYVADAAFTVVTPDAVFSDGFVARLQMHAEAGARCVHTTGLRLNLERFRELYALGRKMSGQMAASPRDLVALACSTLHPCNIVHFWNAEGEFLPSNLIWPVVGGDGLLVHSFHTYPAMIRPTCMPESFGTTLDDDFALRSVPDLGQHICLTDSDHGCAFELSPADKRLAGQTPRGIDGVRAWLPNSANALHRWTARHAFRLHAGDIERTVNLAPWLETEARAAAIMGEILA